MSPHAEKATGQYRGNIGSSGFDSAFGAIYKEVPGTRHKTGDTTSPEAKKSHNLLTSDPDHIREVKDSLGEPCKTEDEAIEMPIFDIVEDHAGRKPRVKKVNKP